MRIPKLKKEPKIMTVRKCKNFDKTTFLADLSKIQFDEIKILLMIQIKCGRFGKRGFLMY